jgi:hypothetical protein
VLLKQAEVHSGRPVLAVPVVPGLLVKPEVPEVLVVPKVLVVPEVLVAPVVPVA